MQLQLQTVSRFHNRTVTVSRVSRGTQKRYSVKRSGSVGTTSMVCKSLQSIGSVTVYCYNEDKKLWIDVQIIFVITTLSLDRLSSTHRSTCCFCCLTTHASHRLVIFLDVQKIQECLLTMYHYTIKTEFSPKYVRPGQTSTSTRAYYFCKLA